MSDLELIEKEQNKKKNNLIEPILIGVFIISISLLFCLCLTKNNKNNKKNQKPKIFVETPNKIIINPYVSPNRVEGILDNLFFPYHFDIIKTVDEFDFLRDTLGKVELRMIIFKYSQRLRR